MQNNTNLLIRFADTNNIIVQVLSDSAGGGGSTPGLIGHS